MISVTFLALCLALYFLATTLLKKFAWKNPPPGPKGLPFIGNVLQMDKTRYKSYSKWAYEYGPIYRFDMLGARTVVISDHKLLKETLSQSAFTGRPNLTNFDAVGNGDIHGVIFTDGPHWEELRRFTLRQLRDFGFGKQSLGDSIMVEVNDFMDGLKNDCKKPITNFPDRLLFAVVNSLWTIVTGERFDREGNDELLELSKREKDVAQSLMQNGLLIAFPKLAKWLPELSGYIKSRKIMDELVSFITRPIKGHKTTLDENFNRDFTDVFLSEMKKSKDPKSAFYGAKADRHLIGLTMDFYVAGTDTTSTTLSWMALYLSKMPEIQRKIQAEIAEITNGNSRQVELSDRPNMPYTEALLSEVMRYSSITPFGFFHRTTEDVKVEGYNVPKDTMVIPNLRHIHFDPKVWGDPENFRPERFLSPDRTKYKKNDALVPFSIGKRQCLGESLARDTLFLFATNMFQKFWIEFDNNGPDNGWEADPTIGVLTPLPFNLIVKERV